MPELDETQQLLASVQAELSVAEAELTARTAGAQAELDALASTAADFDGKREALLAERQALLRTSAQARQELDVLRAQQVRLRERLGATMWASAAIALLCAVMLPYPLTSGWDGLAIVAGGQAAGAGAGWLLGGLIGRRRG